jgi:hypothetical protein
MAEGGAFYVLHDPSKRLTYYKRRRRREIIAEATTGWTPVLG